MSILRIYLEEDNLLQENIKEIEFKEKKVILQYTKIPEKKAMDRVKKYVFAKYAKICKNIAKRYKKSAQSWEEEYDIDLSMSTENFIKNLSLIMIDVKKDKTIVLVFDANNMFGDKTIEVFITSRGVIEAIELNSPEDD